MSLHHHDRRKAGPRAPSDRGASRGSFRTAASARSFGLRPKIVGALAQLGERLNRIQQVIGSIPIGSTNEGSLRDPATVTPGASGGPSRNGIGRERPFS